MFKKRMFKKRLLVLFILLLVVVPVVFAIPIYKRDADVTFSGEVAGMIFFTYGDGAGDSPCFTWDPPFWVETKGAICYEDYDQVEIVWSIEEQQYGTQAGTTYLNLNAHDRHILWVQESPERCAVYVEHMTHYDHNEFVLYGVGSCFFDADFSLIQWEDPL